MKMVRKQSKKQKLSLKYNIQKRVREHTRRMRKQAKKVGLVKRKKRDPGIPNSWPGKADLLEEIEKLREKRDLELRERKKQAKTEAAQAREAMIEEQKHILETKEQERKRINAAKTEMTFLDSLLRVFEKASVIIQVLDTRDPLGCRCMGFEKWAHSSGKRVIFVLSKANLVAPQVVVEWMLKLGQWAPVVAVQEEAGRDGVKELLQMLGHTPTAETPSVDLPPSSVGIVGYEETGQKGLSKAIRQEVRGSTGWFIDGLGRFPPPPRVDEDMEVSLRRAFRQDLKGIRAIEVVAKLLGTISADAILRRFRIPRFANTEEFLIHFAKLKKMKTRKGRVPEPTAIADKALKELTDVLPGCFCAPPAELPAEGNIMHWETHGVQKQHMQTVMESQINILRERPSTQFTNAIFIDSGGFGPEIDFSELLSEIKSRQEIRAARAELEKLHAEALDGLEDDVDDDDEGEEEESDEDMDEDQEEEDAMDAEE